MCADKVCELSMNLNRIQQDHAKNTTVKVTDQQPMDNIQLASIHVLFGLHTMIKMRNFQSFHFFLQNPKTWLVLPQDTAGWS